MDIFEASAMIMMSGSNKVIQPLNVTENGSYEVPEGVDGYNPVNVNVPSEAVTEGLSVTTNGTYTPPSGVDGYNPVIVNVPSSPMSLDGLNALRTLATVTIGAYTFEIKEPKLLYPGKVNVDIKKSYDSGTWECGWIPTVILNRTIAAIGNNVAATESRSWGEYTDNDGNSYSKYYSSYSDFAVKNVNVYKQDDKLPNFNIQWSYTQISGYDTGAGETYHGTSSSDITSFYYLFYPSLSGLSYDEYFQFVKNYLEKTAGVDPVVTIL